MDGTDTRKSRKNKYDKITYSYIHMQLFLYNTFKFIIFYI